MFPSSHLHIYCIIFSSSHLLIFTSIYTYIIFSSSHLHIYTYHLLTFTSAHRHICSSSHLLIFRFAHIIFLTFTSSHLHISTSSHVRIFTSARLSYVFFLPRLLFILLSLGRGLCQRGPTKCNLFARNEVWLAKTEVKLQFWGVRGNSFALRSGKKLR